MTTARLCATLCALAFSCATPLASNSNASSRAGPRWASDADQKTEQGNVFTCQGEGKSEDDALSAALGICNDKICKVCGVEVESIVETKETLTGVDLMRKIVERCKRVRTHDTLPRYKSSECGPAGCQAWVQILYTKADELAECPRYQKDDFADPLACEKDIDTFRHTEGRSAESFRKRTQLLDAALGHCEKIDVRPTPALLALDEKLRAGLDAFEFTEKLKGRLGDETSWMVPNASWGRSARDEAVDTFKPQWAWFLSTFEPLRQEIGESKLLAQRLKLVRDYVANRALVFDVLEAATAKGLDTPEGTARLSAALRRAPTGGQYGSPDVHFSVASVLIDLQTDTQAIQAWFRGAYPPGKFESTVRPGHLARLFAADKKVTREEWDWTFAASQEGCATCLRMLLAAREHGGEGVRMARFQMAFEQGVSHLKKAAPTHQQLFRVFKDLAPMKDPAFLTLLEPKLPEGLRAGLDWDFFSDVVQRFEDDQTEEEQQLWLVRAASEAAKTPAGGETEQSCNDLDKRWEVLENVLAPLEPLFARTCACLSGPLAQRSRWNKWELLERAYAYELPCARVPGTPKTSVPPKKTVLTFPPTPDAGGECRWREPRPPRVVIERPYVTVARPLDKDWVECAQKANGTLSLQILLQQEDGPLASYENKKLRGARLEEKAWLSNICGREGFGRTTGVQFVLTGTGAAANASWTSPVVPMKCPCTVQDKSSLVVKSVPEGLSIESRADQAWLACHTPGSLQLRLFAARTQREADALVLPTAVVPALEKGVVETLIPKSKLCAAGPWVSTALWATGALSDERNKGNEVKKLDCR